MAQGSTRFEHLEKSIDDYIIDQQNKNTRAKTTRDVKLLTEFLSKKNKKPSKSKNWRIIFANLSLVWSEKTAKTLNLQVLVVCFQVLIDIWKNAI